MGGRVEGEIFFSWGWVGSKFEVLLGVDRILSFCLGWVCMVKVKLF
jgi:hypothetical protein